MIVPFLFLFLFLYYLFSDVLECRNLVLWCAFNCRCFSWADLNPCGFCTLWHSSLWRLYSFAQGTQLTRTGRACFLLLPVFRNMGSLTGSLFPSQCSLVRGTLCVLSVQECWGLGTSSWSPLPHFVDRSPCYHPSGSGSQILPVNTTVVSSFTVEMSETRHILTWSLKGSPYLPLPRRVYLHVMAGNCVKNRPEPVTPLFNYFQCFRNACKVQAP